MARHQAEIRREEIVQAAVTVVARLGFARTRIADVAAELGVSRALVFYHFDTKERLLSEAFLHAAQADLARLDRVVARAGTAAARLGGVLRLYAPTGAAPGWRMDLDVWGEALRSPELLEVSRRVDRRWRAAIEQVVADGVRSGEFVCARPKQAAERIAVMLDGLGVATQVRGSVPRARATRWAAEHAAREVGVAPDALLSHSPHRPAGG